MKRRPSRAIYTECVPILLSVEQRQILAELATTKNISMSAVIRGLLDPQLENAVDDQKETK